MARASNKERHAILVRMSTNGSVAKSEMRMIEEASRHLGVSKNEFIKVAAVSRAKKILGV